MATLTKRDFRAIIYFNFSRGLSKEDCFKEISEVFSNDCPSVRTVERWYLQFRRGVFDLEDEPHTGRLSNVATPETVDAAITVNRRITFRQLEVLLHISKSTLQRIVSEQLSVKKVCALWVPYALSDEQRKNRVEWCKSMLKKFKSGSADNMNFIVTGDLTWLYYYDVPTKSQNKVWVFEDEEVPVPVRKSKCIDKRIVAVFFTKDGIIETVLLDKSKTVTSQWYTETCLPQLFKNLVYRSPLDSWFLHQDNTLVHQAATTQEFLEGAEVKLLKHPAYSPDLAPCDFGLFPYVKLRMKGRHFLSDEELVATFREECDFIPKQMWEKWFDEWFLRMKKCITCDGKYLENV